MRPPYHTNYNAFLQCGEQAAHCTYTHTTVRVSVQCIVYLHPTTLQMLPERYFEDRTNNRTIQCRLQLQFVFINLQFLIDDIIRYFIYILMAEDYCQIYAHSLTWVQRRDTNRCLSEYTVARSWMRFVAKSDFLFLFTLFLNDECECECVRFASGAHCFNLIFFFCLCAREWYGVRIKIQLLVLTEMNFSQSSCQKEQTPFVWV